MFFDIALYVALIIFAIGLIHKVDTWFILNVGVGDRNIPVSNRFAAGIKGIATTIFSVKIFSIIKVLIVDVLFQARILKDRKDPLAWVMHFCIFLGFMLLLIFHALGSVVTVALNPEYQSTLNPFLFLRDLFGLLVLAGLIMAVIRRATVMKDHITTGGADKFAIAVLVLIICSGFALQALKTTSRTEYLAMVADYGDDSDPQEAKALEAFWVENYGLVSGAVKGPFSDQLLVQGEELHELSCMECHAKPQTAFISYTISRIIKPLAVVLDRAGFTTLLWYIHFLASFFGLAYLCFGKMFHLISTPVSLILAAVAPKEENAAAAATRRTIELEGCSHGGLCHEECPVRQRRLDRIADTAAFDPMLVYAGGRSAAELGSRPVSD